MNAVELQRGSSADDHSRRLLVREVECAEIKHDIVAYPGDLAVPLGEAVAVYLRSVGSRDIRKLPLLALEFEAADLVAEIGFERKGVNAL